MANALEALMPAGGPRLDIVAQPRHAVGPKIGLPSDAHNECYDRT